MYSISSLSIHLYRIQELLSATTAAKVEYEKENGTLLVQSKKDFEALAAMCKRVAESDDANASLEKKTSNLTIQGQRILPQ